MDAIIYIRWSSLEQTKGDSYARQINRCTKFCADKGYNVLETVVDEGRSAYTGENILTGNLGKLVERFERREVPEGTLVVVEQLDRLTRLPALEVVGWLTRVFPTGIKFVTADRGTMVSRAAMEADQLSFMSLIFDSFRSHGESKRKSDLLLDSWQNRRKDVVEGKKRNITGVCPAWLRWDKEVNEFVVITDPDPHLDRRLIIQRIFDERDAGVGHAIIARKLNEDGIPSWGVGKRKADGWHPSYVYKILHNPAVIGEFQPRSRRKGEVTGTKMGQPIPDYYPQIISPAQFERVSASKQVMNVGGGTKGRVNLLAGLVYCGVCNQRMIYLKKANAGRARTNPKTGTVTIDKSEGVYLKCSGAHRGHRCDHKAAFNYHWIAEAVLDNLLNSALRDVHFEQRSVMIQLADQLASARRELERFEAQAQTALDMTLDPAFKHDQRVKQRYIDVGRQADQQRELVNALDEKLSLSKGQVSPAEHLNRVASVRTSIDSEDEKVRDAARTKVMDAFQRLIDRITFKPDRTVEVSALEGSLGWQFDDKGKLVNRFDLTVGLNEDRLRNGLLRRDNVDRQDIAQQIEEMQKRRLEAL
ncbi:recombinase family protein [Sphingobium sp. LSP13-1-1.1]|uniref:recombinase family protein n=1 Tax=Sphingobium sp. LSP13-1-1.1 TaxID=3135234 RepID=UPI00341C8665